MRQGTYHAGLTTRQLRTELAGQLQQAGLRLLTQGLAQVQMFPQWATDTEGSYLQTQRSKLLLTLTPEDTQRGREALTQAEAAGTFFMAEPLHCAVGPKR